MSSLLRQRIRRRPPSDMTMRATSPRSRPLAEPPHLRIRPGRPPNELHQRLHHRFLRLNGDGLRMSKTVGPRQRLSPGISPRACRSSSGASTDYITGPGGLPVEQIKGVRPCTTRRTSLARPGCSRTPRALRPPPSPTPLRGPRGRSGKGSTPLLYDGQYMDTESGLYYLQARYYDPATGQFLDPDAGGLIDG